MMHANWFMTREYSKQMWKETRKTHGDVHFALLAGFQELLTFRLIAFLHLTDWTEGLGYNHRYRPMIVAALKKKKTTSEQKDCQISRKQVWLITQFLVL